MLHGHYIYRNSGFLDPDKPMGHYPELELDVLLHKEPTRTQVDGANVTFESLIPRIRKSS